MVDNAASMQNFLVYPDTMSLVIRIVFYSVGFIAGIWIVYKNYNLVKTNKLTSLAVFLAMGLIVFGVVRNAIFAMQQEPELATTQQGISFHKLGFLPWSAIESARIIPSKLFFIPNGRKARSLLRIKLKQEAGWQPVNSSWFSISNPYKNKAIVIKDVLAIERAELKDILIQMNPSLILN